MQALTGSWPPPLNPPLAGTGRTLRLCYLRHAYGLGEHYESVVPGLVLAEDDEEAEAEAEAAAGEPEAAAAELAA